MFHSRQREQLAGARALREVARDVGSSDVVTCLHHEELEISLQTGGTSPNKPAPTKASPCLTAAEDDTTRGGDRKLQSRHRPIPRAR